MNHVSVNPYGNVVEAWTAYNVHEIPESVTLYQDVCDEVRSILLECTRRNSKNTE